ncbi:hypothetical protein [Aquirhabdus parva]|uniref:Uncharacterized protein n=1 Tax=Aquirhabdus parva TaxID=2283318 RepID=A0A345P3B5_9GAMM|nr:hypothetical protein [Aquirhabdus parva]AXI01774.1 hypothetical protein HYN46_02090 [Aquirhabdus parva]
MPHRIEPVTLEVETPVRYKTWLHTTRDYHLIGVIAFSAPETRLTAEWDDLEYIRRRADEFSIIGFPEFLAGMVIDLRDLPFLLDAEAPIFPWRMMEEDCPIRVLVSSDHRAHYSSVFEPAWLGWDLDACISDIRTLLDSKIQ